ncbi:MAG: methyltransferase domain-containing protein [Bacteroidetes bacterium]|nr:methyltransferase domain-containing protein [Bacteroidota bacterium]
MKKTGWFSEWFDTEYYHMLYRRRDDAEAAAFVRTITAFLQLNPGSRVADIACGKGRHSRVLAGMGFEVHGFDLSKNNIEYATKHASGKEQFTVQDIREPYPDNNYHAAFNLFTSFGYFETRAEDLLALSNIFQMLNPGGYFVQDYINAPPVLRKLPHKSTESCSGVKFFIEKSWNPPFITKKITVEKAGASSEYQEKVKLYEADELKEMHVQCGFEVLNIFGDYQLQPVQRDISPRLIVISRKPDV